MPPVFGHVLGWMDHELRRPFWGIATALDGTWRASPGCLKVLRCAQDDARGVEIGVCDAWVFASSPTLLHKFS
jgi:hypothetical protein